MKKMMKKNQIVITALAIMIAVAGYLNFSGSDQLISPETAKTLSNSEQEKGEKEAEGAKGNSDEESVSALVDDEVIETAQNEEALENTEAEVGEAVMANTNVSNFLLSAKLNREQARAQNIETLQGVIDSENLSEAQKDDAVAQMLKLTESSEKESNCEQLLGAKGFTDSLVTVSEKTVDVLVKASELTEVQKAQIEDIVTRKTGCEISQIEITTYE